MTDSSEWELSKENVQPLREGRKIATLTSALQHTPTDFQHLREQRNFFEQQLRIYDGEDSLVVWDSYIKWTEQNFPRGGKDGNLLELLQRCLTHFQDHDGYKNDSRFVHLWIKFANFSDDPVEIYQYMFDQKIGCGLTMLYEDWANFVERLGNSKKADSIYLEGISRGAQPLDALKLKHSEFQMRVARGVCLQPREEAHERIAGEEQRTVLGGLKADKKNRVGSTRTGTAKLGMPRGLGSSVIAPKQVQTGTGFQVFQDENAPMSSAPQQTGEQRSLPVREKLNRENEQLPGVWTKARAPQRKGVAAAAATPAKPTFEIHEDENAKQDHHTTTALVDSHVLSTRKTEKPGHLLDPIRKGTSHDERPMYCKEKVYCGTQEFSLEEIRALKYFEKKKKREQEEEQKRLVEEVKAMRLIHDQFQKEIQNMKAEHRQIVESQRQKQESSGVQPSPMPIAGGGLFQSAHNTPVFGAPLPLASSSSASFNAPPSSAPSSANFSAQLSSAPSSGSFHNPHLSAPSSASFHNPHLSAPSSGSFHNPPLSAPSSGSFHNPPLSAPSSGSFHNPPLSASSSVSFTSSANSSIQRAASAAGGGSVASRSGGLFQNSSLNMSQRTPGQNMMQTSVGSRPPQQHGAGPTPDGNSSKNSLSGTSPTINTKEALQMVQGMYNATLDCDKINEWEPEDTEMTVGVPPPAPQPASIVVFDENQEKAAKSAAVLTIFCDDENVPPQENRRPASSAQKRGGLGYSGSRLALQEKPVMPALAPVTHEFMAVDDALGEGTEFYPHIDQTLAAVGSQDSFVAAARAASTPFGLGQSNTGRLPSLPLSSIKPHTIAREKSDEEMTDGASVQTNDSQAHNSQNAPFVTLNHTGVTLKDLSPIIEGSSEGSSEESKSHAASSLGVSSALKTPALPPRPAPLISREHLAPVSSTDHHVITTSHYVPAQMDEKTEALLSMSVCIDPPNPFDQATIKSFLERISPPLAQREGYVQCNQHVPNFIACSFINLGMDTYQLNQLIGEGGHAKVYLADFFIVNLDDSCDTMDIEHTCPKSCVIKVQKPAAPWEYYISSELHHRLQIRGLAHMRPSMMDITHGYFYQDGSCLVSDYCPLGSLLSQVNMLKNNRELMNSLEPLAAYLTIHMLRIVESLHRCHIIHGDIKPDNILITGFPELPSGSSKEAYFGAGSQGLRLVDFGQAIDMTLYPPDTTFTAKVGTSGFQCNEMMNDQPWTYQTDLYGLAGSVHVLVFGQYMKVYCSQGQSNMTSNFQRKWKVELWKKLFHQLLNIADCDHQPDLGSLCREFEEHFMSNLETHLRSLLSRVRSTLVSARSSH